MLRRVVCFAVLLTSISASTALAQTAYIRRGGKADKETSEGVPAGKRMRVIIGHDARAGAALKGRIGSTGRVKRELGMSGAFSAEMNAKEIDALIKDRRVRGVAVDSRMWTEQDTSITPLTTTSSTTSTTTSVYDGQNLRTTLGLVPSNYGYSVGVAIIDSGIAQTPDLRGRISAFYDFTGGTIRKTPPSDGYRHGTHIAGLIAGSGASSSGKYVGMATYARLIGLKVLDDTGAGYTSDVIAALDFAVANKAALGIDVINLSLGHPIFESAATDPLVQAVERAVDAGIVVVVAAGNYGMNPVTGEIGYAGISSPSNAPSALTVGSLRHKATASRLDDEISMFSSRGPTWYDGFSKPDIIAPGQALVATATFTSTLGARPELRVDYPGYIKLSGTSMAAGVASGVVADMIEANRRNEEYSSVLTPNTIKAILQYTAIPLPDEDASTPSSLEQGTGGINAAGAIALTTAIEPNAPVGTPWLETGIVPYTYLPGTGSGYLRWSQHIVWGDHIVWGETALWKLEAWAQHIVWGEDDDHIVWGDNFLQGTSLVLDSILSWGHQIVWSTDDDHIVWGDDDDHIVWGDDDHIVWGD